MRMNNTRDSILTLIDETDLTEKEKTVITKRLLNYTLKEIANYYKLSTERIRQIEAKGVRKLRHHSRFGKHITLKDWGFNVST